MGKKKKGKGAAKGKKGKGKGAAQKTKRKKGAKEIIINDGEDL